jgi:hypothetical protein
VTSDPTAKHILIANPEPREAILNVQAEGGELLRFRLNRDQLFFLNDQIATILLKDFK